MSTKIKIGRPPSGTEAPTLETLHVRIDAETKAALERLERALGAGTLRGVRSVAVRKAVIEAAARLNVERT